MDLLKAELARKKSSIASIRSELQGNGNGNVKFLRQSDIQEIKEKRQRQLEEEEQSDKRQRFDNDNDNDNNNVNDIDHINNKNNNNSNDTNNEEEEPQSNMQSAEYYELSKLNPNQINQRFRKIGEPIILFGEILKDRINRLVIALTKYYNQEGKDEDRTRTGNLYNANVSNSKSKGVLSKNEYEKSNSDDDNLRTNEKNGKIEKGKNQYDPSIKYSEMNNLSSEMMVYKYFRSILKAWERDLDGRSDAEKTSAKGKNDAKTQKQCKDYVRPLFKMCKSKNVPPDILLKLEEMVRLCENGDFRAANEKYLLTAIGNAAWPMGLSGVSIHQRAAQDNVGKSNIAHVMNNEIQRKYLTSVKRLMTYAQDLRTDVPPSMKVL